MNLEYISKATVRVQMKLFGHVTAVAIILAIAFSGVGCEKEGVLEPASSTSIAPATVARGAKGDATFSATTESNIISVTKRVTKKDGGVLKLTYDGGTHNDKVKLTIQFKVAPKSISRDCDITMSLDADKLLTEINIVDLSFEPSGISFTKPASLSVEGKGLNLAGLPKNAKPKFYYWDEDANTWVVITFKKSQVNIDLGMINLDDGEVSHFSRYAFGF
jgi:hypothetical protein